MVLSLILHFSALIQIVPTKKQRLLQAFPLKNCYANWKMATVSWRMRCFLLSICISHNHRLSRWLAQPYKGMLLAGLKAHRNICHLQSCPTATDVAAIFSLPCAWTAPNCADSTKIPLQVVYLIVKQRTGIAFRVVSVLFWVEYVHCCRSVCMHLWGGAPPRRCGFSRGKYTQFWEWKRNFPP